MNINDHFFDSPYKDIWKSVIPNDLTVKEVDFMIPFFKLDSSSHVLDLMCGYGRHAIALAQKGITVTAVDNLQDYIEEIKELVKKESLPLTAVKQNVLQFSTDQKFDLVICMGNSLNFFNAADTSALLHSISSFLKPGGHLLINSWSVAEIAIKNFKEKTWSTVGETKFLTESKYLFHPTRIETDSIMISPDGKTESRKGIDYIFTIGEMENMMQKAGLHLEEVYSIPGKKKFMLGEPRAYFVATKN
jgi:2-polyprenyl-3-methyl-5-hydroxy-6-metoxy-1,4-benzoquinol methylase